MLPEEPRILILACSATKTHQAGGPAPAVQLYDGPAFRVYRKWARRFPVSAATRVDVWILSAEHGLISGHRTIATYDRKLTRERIPELVIATRRAALAGELADRGSPAIFLFGGCLYAALLAELLPDHYPFTRAGDGGRGRAGRGIGAQLAELHAWLYAIPEVSRT